MKSLDFFKASPGGVAEKGVCWEWSALQSLVLKKLYFCKASPGEETEEGVCFQWMLKIVSATVYGFLY